MNPRRRRRIPCLVLTLLTPVAVGLFLWAACAPPRDRVNARIVGLPDDPPFYCLAAWAVDGPQPLEWYSTYWGQWYPHRPNGKSWRRPLPFGDGDSVPVRWRPADQYGLITYSPAAGWRVYRFRADEIPLEGGGPFSSRQVTFDLTGRPAEPLDPATVERLGLTTVPQDLADIPPPPRNP